MPRASSSTPPDEWHPLTDPTAFRPITHAKKITLCRSARAFMEGEEDLVKVNVSGKDANYLRTQLIKRIDTRNLRNVKVSVVNNVCYLEKT